MSLPLTGAGPSAGGSYATKVLSYSPIVYWIQGEAAGLTAIDQVNSPAQDGTYTGVVLGQAGIGDGNTSPLYDGANDYTDIYTATFAGAFNGSEGTAMFWARASAAGVWTDGAERRGLTLRADGNNRVFIRKDVVNNTITWHYQAGAVSETRSVAGYTTTDWFSLAITWSVTAGINGEVCTYYNGAPSAATMTNLGAWVGALVNGLTVIGAKSVVPASVWSGTLAHCAIWDRALSPVEIARVAVI